MTSVNSRPPRKATAASRRQPTPRVASDATRSVLSAHSVKSVASAGVSSSTPLARRLLNPPSKAGAPLPPIIPLTTSAHETLSHDIPRLNDELYDLISLALRGYVSSWYTRLSPRDREFVPEISTAIVAVLQEFDRRVRAADLDLLILHDIPNLVSQHYRDYRLARTKLRTSYANASSHDSDPNAALAHIFHNIQSHLAVSADGTIDDTYLRQAMDHILKTCLPPQHWASEMERSIIREVLVKPIFGSILPKLAQPWFLHSIALSLLGSPRPVEPPAPPPPKDPQPSLFKPQHLIIGFLTLVQLISTFCLNAISIVQRSRALIAAVNDQHPAAPSYPSGYTNGDAATLSDGNLTGSTKDIEESMADIENEDYTAPLMNLLAVFLSMEERRTSASILSLLDTASGFGTSFLNKLLKYLLGIHVLTPSRMTSLVLLSKRILFPDGYPGPPPVEPSIPEQIILREGVERRLRELIPSLVSAYILGPTPRARGETIREALEPLSSVPCNVHLVMLIFDAVTLTLFPEMGIAEGTKPESSGMAPSMSMGTTGSLEREEEMGDGEGDDEMDASGVDGDARTRFVGSRSEGVPLTVF